MNRKNTALHKAIKHVGGRRQLADKLGIKRQHIEYWLKNSVPVDWLIDLETATGISREEFRPDIFFAPLNKKRRKTQIKRS